MAPVSEPLNLSVLRRRKSGFTASLEISAISERSKQSGARLLSVIEFKQYFSMGNNSLSLLEVTSRTQLVKVFVGMC
jgi:hypothetical protein